MSCITDSEDISRSVNGLHKRGMVSVALSLSFSLSLVLSLFLSPLSSVSLFFYHTPSVPVSAVNHGSRFSL